MNRRGERTFYIFINIVLGVLSFAMMVPFFKVLSTSLSSAFAVDTGQVFLYPVELTTASWERILSRQPLWRSLGITVTVTVAGTLMSLLISALLAYPLAKKEFAPAKIILLGVVITMIFRYPIIPYFLVVREIGLYNNPLVLVIPHLLTAYNLIIMRTFFKQFPIELEESAQLEGCGYFQILFRIVLPLSKAVLATLGIFYAVMYWNQFMNPLMFIESQNLYPLQLTLRQYIVSTDYLIEDVVGNSLPKYNSATMKAATVIFATVPIILVYPFLQKHFVKGALLGSIK